jgi:uncharacterized membrane protein (UPF0182 family)
VFPGLIKSANSMPASVKAHVRYPEDLFDVQRALLAQYHVDDPVTFYNGSDRWQVPSDPFEPSAGDQPSYYVLANAPNQQNAAPEFQLTSPMLVNNSPNLAAYISANSDPGKDYGKLTVLRVSDKSAVQGPTQVANTLRTKSEIAANIRLLNGGGTESSVIHGNLLTLPLGDSFLYVEPLYAASTYPTLQRVLVSYGNNLGFGATLADALSDFLPGHHLGQTLEGFGQGTGTSTGGGSSGSSSSSSSTSTPSSAPSTSSGPSTLPTDAGQILQELKSVQQQLHNTPGDQPLKIAQLQQREQDLVNRLIQVQATASASPSPSK